jgi:predicted exporter
MSSSLNTSTPRHFNTLFPFFSTRRRLLALLVALLWLASLAGLATLRVDEDIRSMIPRDPPELARQFELLQQSPLSGKVLVQVSAGEGTTTAELVRAADRLAREMGPPLFGRVMTGPPVEPGRGLLPFLIRALPGLFTERDRERAAGLLAPTRVRERLERILRDLRSPEGWATRAVHRRDPLGLRLLALGKLRHVSPIPEVRVEGGQFVSPDGRHALLVAETPVPMTDAEGGKALIDRFQALAGALPSNVDAFLYSGHLYTVANAETVREDLLLVLSASSAALLLLFLVFVRSWNGLLILLVPASTLLVASAGTGLVYEPVSAVTLGFGAVLLGISIDFGIHVYFALRRAVPGRAAEAAGRVAVPVLFGGITSMSAFGVLLLSRIPGQRQLGVFALIGLACALVLSLVALPHGVRPVRGGAGPGARPEAPRPRRPRWIVWAWIAFLLLAGWQATRLGFEGDLRELNRAPAGVLEREARLNRAWGGLLGRALVTAGGADLTAALQVNDRVFDRLVAAMPASDVMSLAPVLPSPAVQSQNRDRWRAFWTGPRVQETRRALLAAGRDLGFSPGAFDPFFEWVEADAPVVEPDDLARAGLGRVLDSFAIRSESGVRLLSTVPDAPGLKARLQDLLEGAGEVALISPAGFGDALGRALARDFLVFVLGAVGAVLLLLGLLHRSAVRLGLSLVPVVTGLLAAFGGMALLGVSLNVFNMVAVVLIIGLGVDYGVFMVMRGTGKEGPGTRKAVLVSGLTTLAGFGALAPASHPALHAMGVTVLLGIGAAVPSALWVIPALKRKRGGRP